MTFEEIKSASTCDVFGIWHPIIGICKAVKIPKNQSMIFSNIAKSLQDDDKQFDDVHQDMYNCA